MYVDIYRANTIEQRHLLRELTQSLGLAKDSFKYPNSIFQSSWTQTLNYMEIDKDVISYFIIQMSTGLNALAVEDVLRNILLSEK